MNWNDIDKLHTDTLNNLYVLRDVLHNHNRMCIENAIEELEHIQLEEE